MSPEFFAVDNFPPSKFSILSIDGNSATGEFTLRGHTSKEKVENISITAERQAIRDTDDLTINRQKYAMTWASPMQDMAFSNYIVLHIE